MTAGSTGASGVLVLPAAAACAGSIPAGSTYPYSSFVRRMPTWTCSVTHSGLVARTDRPDAVALDDRRALGHGDRAEVGERDRPAVGGLDRHALAVPRDHARERDEPCCRSMNHVPELASDVEPAVVAGCFRLIGVERDRAGSPARLPATSRHRPARRSRARSRGRAEIAAWVITSSLVSSSDRSAVGVGMWSLPRRRGFAPRGQVRERLFATVRRAVPGVNGCGSVVAEL